MGAEGQSTPLHRLPLGIMMPKQYFTFWRSKGCTSTKQVHLWTFSCSGHSGDNGMLVELRCSHVVFWGSTSTDAYLLCARSTQCHCLVCSVQSLVLHWIIPVPLLLFPALPLFFRDACFLPSQLHADWLSKSKGK